MSTQAIAGEIVKTPPDLGEIIVDKRGCKRYKATGQLLKGQVLNPTGRPQTRVLSERFRQRLEDGKANVIADRIIKMAEKGRENLALQAAQFIADRTEGKPLQAVAVQHSVDESTMKRIAELYEKLFT